MRVYDHAGADFGPISARKIAGLGHGSQRHARNLRDSGVDAIARGKQAV